MCEVLWKYNPHEIERLLCRLITQVNHALVRIFNIENMYFHTIREIKILAKIPEFTVI